MTDLQSQYTCREYREEMTLLGLKKRLNDGGLSDKERKAIEQEIAQLESSMNLD